MILYLEAVPDTTKAFTHGLHLDCRYNIAHANWVRDNDTVSDFVLNSAMLNVVDVVVEASAGRTYDSYLDEEYRRDTTKGGEQYKCGVYSLYFYHY